MNWLTSLIIVVIGIAAIGCTAGTTTPESTRSSNAQTPAHQNEAALGSILDSADAQTIVAAQEKVLSDIYDSALPSVVHIRVTQRVAQEGFEIPFPFPFGFEQGPREFFRQGEGSGFLWDGDGHIVTNYHVIQDASRVTVSFSNGSATEAEVLGQDPNSDLAVLKVDQIPQSAAPAVLGDSDEVDVGELAIAIGNPFGQEFTMTTGIISAIGRTIPSGVSSFSIPHVIQTDASINPGNSGGPLLNRKGEVIGINTQIISPDRANAGVGFAVPINTARKVVPVLISEGQYDYPWLGISGVTLTAEVADLMDLPEGTRGALVVDVAKDGPADKAGLRGSDKTLTIDGQQYPMGGDVIAAIDDFPIRDMDDLIAHLMENTRPGDEVSLKVLREGGSTDEIVVTLGTRPHTEAQPDGG